MVWKSPSQAAKDKHDARILAHIPEFEDYFKNCGCLTKEYEK